MKHSKFLWFTDTHLDKVSFWKKLSFLKTLDRERPTGIILTGDISNGRQTISDLEMIANTVSCPIYFVLGNHDYYWSSIEKTHDKIRNMCAKHSNLIWMSEAGVVHINEEVAFIGTEGWYNAEEGKPEYLQFTFDWFMIDNFRKLINMEARIDAWRKIADDSATQITSLLEEAIKKDYKSIYILTHVPCWREATRDVGTFMEKLWLPYNTNLSLGRAIEKVMEKHKKKNVTVICGHTHTPEFIRVSRNISCQVGAAKLGKINSQEIYL